MNEARYQWVTFAIHSPEQPNPRCRTCGAVASWLFLRKADAGRLEDWRAWAYCDTCAHEVKTPFPYYGEREGMSDG